MIDLQATRTQTAFLIAQPIPPQGRPGAPARRSIDDQHRAPMR
jgi:hypothetical protein